MPSTSSNSNNAAVNMNDLEEGLAAAASSSSSPRPSSSSNRSGTTATAQPATVTNFTISGDPSPRNHHERGSPSTTTNQSGSAPEVAAAADAAAAPAAIITAPNDGDHTGIELGELVDDDSSGPPLPSGMMEEDAAFAKGSSANASASISPLMAGFASAAASSAGGRARPYGLEMADDNGPPLPVVGMAEGENRNEAKKEKARVDTIQDDAGPAPPAAVVEEMNAKANFVNNLSPPTPFNRSSALNEEEDAKAKKKASMPSRTIREEGGMDDEGLASSNSSAPPFTTEVGNIHTGPVDTDMHVVDEEDMQYLDEEQGGDVESNDNHSNSEENNIETASVRPRLGEDPSATILPSAVQRASARPRARPTPQSMLAHSSRSSDAQAPSVPRFHEVEARLVEEEAPAPVYDATIVLAEEELPRWKKNRKYIALIGILVVIVVVMGTLLGSQGNDESSANKESEGTDLREGKESNTTSLNSFEGEEQAQNSTKVTGNDESNNTSTTIAEEQQQQQAQNFSFSPTASASAKPTDAPTDSPTTVLQQILSSQTKLVPDDGATLDLFGQVIAVDGNTVVVGAPTDDDNDSDIGSAYVFIQKGGKWIQQAKLLPDDGEAGDEFGRAIAVSSNTVVVGATHHNDNGSKSGSVYVFTREGGTWIQQAKLLPNDGEAGDEFGYAIAVSSNIVVVGAGFCVECRDGSNSGSAYVFIWGGDSWKQQAKLLPADGKAGDQFGTAIAVSSNTVVVGAVTDDDKGRSSGSVYVFVREGDKWKQEAKLLPDDGAAIDWFGFAIAVSSNTVVVGAPLDDDNGSNSGSAYVFVREGDTWTQQAKLLPDDGSASDVFGRAIAVSSNTVVVGARLDDNYYGDNSGSAYIFIREGDTWKQEAKLSPDEGARCDQFGTAIAVSNNTVVVGAWLDDDNGNDSGSAYVFSLQQ